MRSKWWSAVALLVATALLVFVWWSRPQRVERTALLMDTPVRVVVYASRGRAEEAADRALELVARLNALWSPGRTDSDVARVNAAAGAAPVSVAPETLELASLALQVARESGGAFDPTIGPLAAAWGFGEGGRVPDDAARTAARALVNWRDLKVDEGAGTLFLARPGMQVDFGAVAKGYAARLVREQLEADGVQAALVQLGGSIALYGDKPGGGPWQIAVQHPRNPQGYLATLSLQGGFVDTAGDYQRYFEQDGVRYHHILNPATGFPATGMASVTVVAPRGEWADAYATAAFVLGMEEGYRFLVDHGVEGLLVSDSGEVRMTPGMAALAEVTPGDWPE
ncbi:MAG: FAD:protein FMN transferase [Symbiobacterium sp.]|uniref:FAD:protein FMN transferase n=1 Tax=Symbiobacterium sp. TaxID=1971213 RepID=UPI003464E50B